jgi:hypothetical protein
VSLLLQHVRVVTGGGDEDGCLVLADGRLVAVLVHLSAGFYEELAGRWYLEAGFGPLDGPEHPVFTDLEAAKAWIRRRMEAHAVSQSARLH